MSFFCGLHVSKWVISLGLCEFTVNFSALVQSEGRDHYRISVSKISRSCAEIR